MESLAFIHTAVSYEDPNPEPNLTVLENVNLKVSNAALMGLAGAAMAASVLGGTSGKAMAASAPVAPGSSGENVQAVQKALGIEADGQFGAKTQSAVMDFQIRQGLKEIDGVVGQETAKALGLDENYSPVGFVDTYSGVGLNIRSGPGTGYWIIGGAPDGAYLEQDYESVIYNDGYTWTPLYTGGWAASNYTTEGYYPVVYQGGCDGGCGGSEYPTSYHGGHGYDEGYYPVSYHDDGGFVETRHRVGLNVRSGPGLDYFVVGGANEGSYVGTYGGVIYRDGYAWQQAEDGAWVATNYLY
jgi:peptidoglycan hydrolase-like protein with peptidoglycan-binding domain